jgi:hypothetical protein
MSSERQVLEQRYARQRKEALLTLAFGAMSIAALLWYYAHQQILLYGDAVAHINIARRVLDNRSWLSSFFQLGTVWLPLPHILMLPFVWNRVLWMSGIAGSIPSMVAYVAGALGIFRLVSARAPEAAAYLAAAIYALNPNMLYMQATAMNEPLYLAFFIWAIVFFDEWLLGLSSEPGVAISGRSPERALEGCGIALAGGAATRYDGWFFGAIMGVLVLCAFVQWWLKTPDSARRRAMSRSLAELLLLNALVPVFWLAYNHRVSGRAMDWANGPFSAMAIAGRTTARGAAPYPGKDHLVTAGLYFLKAAQLNVGVGHWGGVLFVLALLGTALALWQRRTWLLLWVPLAFYSLSIAYGSVPIFIPAWWPFSYYNVRYGLELLPIFAVFPALLAVFLVAFVFSPRRRPAVWSVVALVVAVSYLSIYADVPITLKEAQVNARTRMILENALAKFMAGLPPSATLLMYQGEHVGALQQAGIPLRHVISEVSHPDWEWGLLDPARHADFIIAFKGDPVWTAAHEDRGELTELLSITVPEQAKCTIYRPKQPEDEMPKPPSK